MVHSDYHKRKALILINLRNVVTLGSVGVSINYGCYDQPLEKTVGVVFIARSKAV